MGYEPLSGRAIVRNASASTTVMASHTWSADWPLWFGVADWLPAAICRIAPRATEWAHGRH